MNKEQIREKILFNNKKIEELLDPSVFILQPEVQQLMEDNEYLRTICPHEFENGVCKICGKAE
jgi:hypothetical protein